MPTEERVDEANAGGPAVWEWTSRQQGGARIDFVVRCVSWDDDGSCLALTDDGLRAWDGESWHSVSARGLPDPAGIRFVERSAAGTWIVAGDLATLAVYSATGVSEVTTGPDPNASYRFASGDLDDLAVIAGEVPGEGVVLYAACGRRWLKPLPLPELSFVTGLSRVADDEWLVAGRLRNRGAAVFHVRPLMFEAERLSLPNVRALFASSGNPDRRLGLAVGSEGTALWWDGSRLAAEVVPGVEELAACAVDTVGRGWVASGGDIWLRESRGRWSKVRQDSRRDDEIAPIVTIFAEPGKVTASTTDGGIIEGRRVAGKAKRKSFIPRPDPKPAARPLTPAPEPLATVDTVKPVATVEVADPIAPVDLTPPPVPVDLKPRPMFDDVGAPPMVGDVALSTSPQSGTQATPGSEPYSAPYDPIDSSDVIDVTPPPAPIDLTPVPPPIDLTPAPPPLDLTPAPPGVAAKAEVPPILLRTRSQPPSEPAEPVIALTRRKTERPG